jgi:small subunit ribosomal protein S16
MLKVRFQRIGRTNDPAFRIVVLEKARAAKSGRIVEQVGTYNPKTKALTLDEEKVKNWIANGAEATGSVHNLLVEKGVVEGKKINVLPKKHPIKKAEVDEVSSPDTSQREGSREEEAKEETTTAPKVAETAEAPAEESAETPTETEAPKEEPAALAEEAPAEETKSEEAPKTEATEAKAEPPASLEAGAESSEGSNGKAKIE